MVARIIADWLKVTRVDENMEKEFIEASGDGELKLLREQDRLLPRASVMKIMRAAKSGDGKISRESREFMQECVTEFILLITSEANEHCCQSHRKTLTGEDILIALEILGFDNYVQPLRIYLEKYREIRRLDKINSNENSEMEEKRNGLIDDPLEIQWEHQMYRYSTVVEDPLEDAKFFIEFE